VNLRLQILETTNITTCLCAPAGTGGEAKNPLRRKKPTRRSFVRKKHPVVSAGRPDLAIEWHTKKNTRLATEVTLGSVYKAWWVCSKDSGHPAWKQRVDKRALDGTGCPACKAEDMHR